LKTTSPEQIKLELSHLKIDHASGEEKFSKKGKRLK